MEEAYCSDQQENQWINLAQAGDLVAFNQLILIYQDVAFRTAKWLVTDENSAEDIVQAVFLAAYHQMSNFRFHSFRAWLLRMIRDTCLDELKRRKHFPCRALESRDDDVEAVLRDQRHIDTHTSPEGSLTQHEVWEWIEQSLHQLPRSLSEVIILIDMERFEYAEAAIILRIPLDAIKSRLAQARACMCHLLNQYTQGPNAKDELFNQPNLLRWIQGKS